jgi:type I restriction enzyme S subunit
MSAWPQVALGEVLADATPGFACGEDVEDGVFQFRMNNITTEGQLDLSKQRRVPRDYRNIDRFLVQSGDVLFNATNSPDLVGKTAFFPGLEEPAVFSNHFLRLRPRDSELDGRYLARWLNLQFSHGRFKGMCRQWVNQATVSRDALSSLKLPLPPLPEQRRIAEILDKADALRAKRRAALAQLDTLTQSIFLDMFGDPTTNPKGWPIAKLGELITVGPQNGLYRPASDYGSGTPILRIDAFYDGVVTELATLKRVRISSEEISLYGLKPGDIVVNRVNSREYLGKSALIPELPEPTVFESNMMRFGVDARRLHPVYLINHLQTRHVRAQILRASKDAVNQSSINQQDVKGISITLPPLAQQERFARYVGASQVLASAHRASAVTLNVLFASLQGQAFAGDL